MYITYEIAQFHRDDKIREYEGKHTRPPESIPDQLPRTTFMPSKLVRISDMAIVSGSQVLEGYCALSYSWNQSGDSVLDQVTGKYKRVDDGKHMIMLPAEHKIKKQKIKEKESLKFKYVKFEGIIQQICQQFNIKYIWYDQMCIDQSNKEEKKREIRNMHHIYGNAYCTVALVPEFYVEHNNEEKNPRLDIMSATIILHEHEYFTRLWTLEEAIKSKRLLFVGRNVHMFGEYLSKSQLYHLNQPLEELTVREILYYAHQRTTTKPHDRAFALINLFPDIIEQIEIDYKQPLEDLLITFYGLLAKNDISILLFGNKVDENFTSAMQEYSFLPTWTGIHGRHKTYLQTKKTTFQNYIVFGRTIQVNCCAYIMKKEQQQEALYENKACLQLQFEDLPPIPDDIIYDEYDEKKIDYYLAASVQLPGKDISENIILNGASYYQTVEYKDRFFDGISKRYQQLSKFIKITKKDLNWYYDSTGKCAEITLIELDLTEDVDDDPFTEYVILYGICFQGYDKNKYPLLYYPVIRRRQGEDYYKAIGTCCIQDPLLFFSGCDLSSKTFLVQ